jgi:predicted transcriptional regulator
MRSDKSKKTGKIDINLARRMVDQGKTQTEIARYFGVSNAAVSKMFKKMGGYVPRVVAFEKASELVEEKIDAMGQLRRINGLIHSELDHIEESLKTAPKEERRALQDQKLKHVGEIRKQLGLLLNIAQALYNVEEVKLFQETVLEVIGSASEELREKIVRDLQQRRALRSSFSIPGS